MPQTNGKLRVPPFINRMDLYLLLSGQYPSGNPFIIKKTIETVYDVLNTELEFTCCNHADHVLTMTPYNMLRLRNLYGPLPCPICNKLGYTYERKQTNTDGLLDTAFSEDMKKNILSDNPQEAAKQIAKYKAEIDREEAKLMKQYQETNVPMAEAVDYDEFMKANPNFNFDTENSTQTDDSVPFAQAMEADSQLDFSLSDNLNGIESTQNLDSTEQVIDSQEIETNYKKPKNLFDYETIFDNGAMDVVDSYEIDIKKKEFVTDTKNEKINQSTIIQEEVINEDVTQSQEIQPELKKPRDMFDTDTIFDNGSMDAVESYEIDPKTNEFILEDSNQTQETNEFSSTSEDSYDIESTEENIPETIQETVPVENDEIQKSKHENTNILLGDKSEMNTSSIDIDDEEEDYGIGKYT